MKEYYDIDKIINIKLIKRDYIVDKINYFQSQMEPKSAGLDNIGSKPNGNSVENKYFKYINKITELQEELKGLDKDISLLNQTKYKIQEQLKKMKSIEAKIFNCIYVDKMSVKLASLKLNYSQSQIYKYLSDIKDKLRGN